MDASLVLDTVYSSDEFRLYCHKVLPCAKRTPHDWASCPFAHPGEKAKRRNIRTHYYSADMCAAVAKGEECKLGSSCPNSHNVFESFLHPQKYRTMMCKDRDKCSRPVCFFAHSPDELRQPTDIRPLQEQQQQHLQAAVGMPGLHAAGSSSEAAMMAALAADYQLQHPAAAMQPGAWQLQMQVASLADQLARATSNTSVMSSTVSAASGPSSPSAINSPAAAAGAAAAAAAAAAAGGNVHHLLRNLVHDANSTRQQMAATQQQLQAMAAGGAACMPLQPGSYPMRNSTPGATGGMLLQLPARQLSLLQQPGMASTSAGSCYIGNASGYMAMDCTEGLSNASMDLTALEPSACSSASLLELSATLPLLTAEQMAQLHSANAAAAAGSDMVLMRSCSSISSSGPSMQWGQQLAAAAAAAQGGTGSAQMLPVMGTPSRLGMHQSWGMQQQQQQQFGMPAGKWQQQQQQFAGQGAMPMQMPGGYAMGQQQQQVMPGQYGYQQGVAAPATQALQGSNGAPLYFMQ